MPFALVTIGLILIVSAIRNTTGDLAKAVKADFTGPNNFLYWVVGIGTVGALGYVDALRTFSRVLLALLVIVLTLRNGGFFSQIQSAIANVQPQTTSGVDPSTGQTVPDVSQTGSAPSTPSTSSSVSSAATSAATAAMPGMGALNPSMIGNLGSFF